MELQKTLINQSNFEGGKTKQKKKTKQEVSNSLTSDYMIRLQISKHHKSRHIDQQKRMENPKMNSHTYGQLIFDKGENICNGEYRLLNK